MMRSITIQKIPGISSIEVNNAAHDFIARHKSHQQSEKIYEMLAEMTERSKHAGCKPLTNSVLQDLDEQEKEWEDSELKIREQIGIEGKLSSSVRDSSFPTSAVASINHCRMSETEITPPRKRQMQFLAMQYQQVS
ncbi:hypothetical protein RJ641_018614 [Dillenia turbinata]|uniref:Uncharacterized protein n=1 Tax=Dillenia turbinata TaxID=194707 RepID=A0AAN8UY28_9MAGN